MWKKTTLGVSCKMYQPKTISVKEMEDDAEYPVFGANGVIGRYREYNHEEPQLLITCRGATCGSVNISLPKSWITGNAMVIQPKTSEISNRYLEYLFRGGVDLSTAITGSAQPQITRKSLEPIEFFYPSLAEQKRIVERLDKAFAEIDKAIATAEAKEGEIERLYESALTEMFIRHRDRLHQYEMNSVVNRLTNGYVGATKGIYLDSGIPYLLARHVKNNTLAFDGKTFVSNDFNRKNKKSILQADDVLLVQSGHIGHTAVVPEEHEGHNCHAMIVISTKKDILSGKFLSLIFNTREVKEQVLRLRTGSTIPHLNCGAVRQLVISIPTHEIQKEILKFSETMTNCVAAYKDAVSKKQGLLRRLRERILSQALQPPHGDAV